MKNLYLYYVQKLTICSKLTLCLLVLSSCTSMQQLKFAEIPDNEYVPKPHQTSTYDCADQFIDIDQQISVDFFEFQLTEALHELSLQTGIPIIADDFLEGLITFKFEGDLTDALEVITSKGDFAYKIYEDYILVSEMTDPKVASTCRYLPKYLMAGELIDTLGESHQRFINNVGGYISITAPRKIHEEIQNTLLVFDVEQGQIVLELSVIEVSREALRVLGIPSYTSPYATFNQSLRKTFQALEDSGHAYIKAMPSIVSIDGKKARFASLKTAWLPHASEYSNSREKIDYGVEMEIVPYISGEQVSLDITKASVSDLEQPITGAMLTNHTISTSVIVADGDYLVLGGLLKKKRKRSSSRLPLVNFVLNSASSEEEVEVLIMIRPRII